MIGMMCDRSVTTRLQPYTRAGGETFFFCCCGGVLAIKLTESGGGAIAGAAAGTCPCHLPLRTNLHGVVTCHGLPTSLHRRDEENAICRRRHGRVSGVGGRVSAGWNHGHDRHNGHAGTCGRREGGEDGGRQEQRLVGDLDLSRP